jgi:hypothetical protein
MIRWLRRWPGALWLPVYVGSIFILNGGQGDAPELAVGAVFLLAAITLGVYLALGPWPGHPRPRAFFWTFGAVAAFYLVAGAVAAHYNVTWGIAALAAGIIPLTAVTLLFAGIRAKTVETESGVADTSAANEDDPFPAIGMNNVPQREEEADERPGSDTPRYPRFAREQDAAREQAAGRRAARRR